MHILTPILFTQALAAEECSFGGASCTTGSCYYYSSNGYSREVDSKYPTGICILAEEANAGDPCSAAILDDFKVNDPLEYTARCPADNYCYFDNSQELTAGVTAKCIQKPRDCATFGFCTENADAYESRCFDLLEDGSTVSGTGTVSESGVCLPGVIPVAGDPVCAPWTSVIAVQCSIDDANANLEFTINRPCRGVCRAIAEGFPATCRDAPANVCKGAAENPCPTGLTCTAHDETTGVFSSAAEGESGYCLSPVGFGEPCLLDIEIADDLTGEVHRFSCTDTYACIIPTVFVEPVTTRCTVAAAVQTPCTVDSCDGDAVCYNIDENGSTLAVVDDDEGVCLLPTSVGLACTDDISEDKSDLYSHLVRSCPEGTVCGIGSLFEITGQAECLKKEDPSVPPVVTEGSCSSGDDCQDGEYCTGSDGLLVEDGSGNCLPAALPGELCADSAGIPVAFCLSTGGCKPSGIWSKCAGEYEQPASSSSIFAQAAAALFTTMFLF